MAEHPIQGLMYTAMQSIKDMIDVNTIVGEAVQTPDGTVIIPISKVGLGFAVGGSDHTGSKEKADGTPMFGGGSGGGVSITPVAFMVVGGGQIRMMPVNPETNIYDRLLDMIPSAIDKISDGISKIKNKDKTEEKNSAEDAAFGFSDNESDFEF